MDFRILGPLEVWSGGRPLGLGGVKQRALLAVLLLQAGRVVSADRLIEDLWGEQPPATATSALWVHVTRLRKALNPGGAGGTAGSVLVTRAPGYLLRVEPGELDLERFDRLVAEGRQALANGVPEDATHLLSQALELWRGPALADLVTEPFAQSQVVRLEELRLTAMEDRIEAELACGRHQELVAGLGAIIAAHPLRERIHGQLVLALYRAGRQGDALGAYQRARAILVEELGIDPGPALQRLHRAVLAQDPTLDWIPPAAAPDAWAADRHGQVAGDVEERRRTVTVVCASFTWAAPDESLDPESLDQLAARYLDRVRAAVTRHGGVVQQLTAEAVTAVFGVPTSHENDPVRAVRALADVRAELDLVSGVLERERGARLVLSGGVETGEVLARVRQPGLVALTGAVPRLAARLEQAAPPGEILLGSTTYGLVRDAVRVAEGPAVRRSSADAPQFSWRLVAVEAGAGGHARNLARPMVGRAAERELLAEALRRTVTERACRVVTVLGPAGIGKSRLVRELILDAGEQVTVLHGRCLDYGEGITHWPVSEVIREALALTEVAHPAEARARLSATLAGEPGAAVVVEQLAALLGLSGAAPEVKELPWAVRKFVEVLARSRPVMLVLDDLHLAEPPLLDLIEHLASSIHGAPVLLCCIARSELLELRPGWPDTVPVALEPLDDAECGQLADNLVGDGGLPEAAKLRLGHAADGNPLFLEELVAMLIEDGVLTRVSGAWTVTTDLASIQVPPSISVLLTARLDRLAPGERAVFERASVVGEVFYQGAVLDLTPEPDRPSVDRHLAALASRQLISPQRPDHASLAGERCFRFRHSLFREIAYAAMPKRRRAELHERVAGWLEQLRDPLGDTVEFIAYHLEQACRLRAQLGLTDSALVRRAVDRLAAAGQRASDRLDHRAATGLLTRARGLLADDQAGLELLPALVANLGYQGDLHTANALAAKGVELAQATADQRLEARLRVEQHTMVWLASRLGETRHKLDQAITLFEQAGDLRGLAAAWLLVARLEMLLLHCAEVEAPVWRSVRHSQAVGDDGRVRQALNLLRVAYVYGPTPAAEAIRRCEALDREAGENRVTDAATRSAIAWLEAMRGNFARAWSLLDEVDAMLRDLGSTVGWIPWAIQHESVAFVAGLAGDHHRAEASLRESCREVEAAGASVVLATDTARLAAVVLAQGREEEAEELTGVSERLSTRDDDLLSQFLWRSVRSRVLARRGQIDQALDLSSMAVALAGRTDALNDQASVWLDRAEVLRAAGDADGGRWAVGRAVACFRRKGNVAAGGDARRLLADATQAG